LEREEGIEVVGGAADNLESPRVLEVVKPVVLLLEIKIPRAGGLDNPQLQEKNLQTEVLMPSGLLEVALTPGMEPRHGEERVKGHMTSIL
jgi:chemotaxis response regulator CheB